MYFLYFAYPVLASFMMPVLLYTNNRKDLKFSHFLLYIIFDCFIVCLFEFVLFKFMHFNIQLSAVITFFAVILFYTPFYRFKRIISSYWFQYVLKYVFYAVCGFLIYYIDGYIPAILCFIFSFMLFIYMMSGDKTVKASKNNAETILNSDDKLNSNERLPDIYHIVYDNYAGIHSLYKSVGFDNSQFYMELEKKGFKMYKNIYSNYTVTLSSVPSFMNMAYTFEYLPPRADNDFRFPFATIDLDKFIIQSQSVTKLSEYGYKIVIDYENSVTQDSIKKYKNNNQDITAIGNKSSLLNTFLYQMLRISILSNTINSESHFQYIHRKSTDISNLPKYIQNVSDKNPYYFFTKVLFPHPPFVFSADGKEQVRLEREMASYEELTDDAFGLQEMFCDNIKGCNPLILASMDKLIQNIKKNNRKSIVIIHSDHGSVFGSFPSLIQKFNILYGVYTFGFEKNDYKDYLPENFSLINSMTYLLNYVSSGNVSLREDKFFDQDIKAMCKDDLYIEKDVAQELAGEIKEYMNDTKNKKF